jgi:hypothetical protein
MDGRDPKEFARQEAVRLKRLYSTKKAIDNDLPRGLRKGKNGKVGRRVDRRKEMKDEAMKAYMKMENKILKRRVREMAAADKKKRTVSVKFNSVNKVVQEREGRRIQQDNEVLSRNLASCQPVYDVRKMEKDTKRMQAQWERNPYTILRQNNKAKIKKENRINKARLQKNGRAFYNVKEFEADVKRMKNKILKGEPTWKRRQRTIALENKHNKARLRKNGRAYYNVKKWESDVQRMKDSIIKGVPQWKIQANAISRENRMFHERLKKTRPQIGSRKEWKENRARVEKQIIWTCSLKAGRLGRNVAPLLLEHSPRSPRSKSPRRPQSARAKSSMRATDSFRTRRIKEMGGKSPRRPSTSEGKPKRKSFMLLGYV